MDRIHSFWPSHFNLSISEHFSSGETFWLASMAPANSARTFSKEIWMLISLPATAPTGP